MSRDELTADIEAKWRQLPERERALIQRLIDGMHDGRIPDRDPDVFPATADELERFLEEHGA